VIAGSPPRDRPAAGPAAAAFARLRWVLVAAPLLVWALFAAAALFVPGIATAGGLLLLGVLLAAFSLAAWRAAAIPAQACSAQLHARQDEILALHASAVAVSSQLALDTVLQTIVDEARRLLGTRYGALAVYDDELRLTDFHTSGVDPQLHRTIGTPRGSGLLGLPLREGQRLRLDDIGAHPRAGGFPAGHPVMRTLLAVPLLCQRGHRGNLYVADREDGAPFAAADEEALVRFAVQAAIAVDNAVLHEQVRELAATRERLRLAGRTYDAVAQLLAFVNVKSQVVREYVRQGDAGEAGRHLEELATTARGLFAQQRARLLDLRALDDEATSTVEAITHHARAWQAETGVDVELLLPSAIDAAPDVELQLLRIVQEGLDNVWRHARASQVRLAVEQDEAGVHVRLSDDGIGFDPVPQPTRARSPRFGLAAMRERARAVGGRLDVESAAGRGTLLRLDLPSRLDAAEEVPDAPAHC
jgi:signal transduction histidine kinase